MSRQGLGVITALACGLLSGNAKYHLPSDYAPADFVQETTGNRRPIRTSGSSCCWSEITTPFTPFSPFSAIHRSSASSASADPLPSADPLQAQHPQRPAHALCRGALDSSFCLSSDPGSAPAAFLSYLIAKSPGKFFRKGLCFCHLFKRTVALLASTQERMSKATFQHLELQLLGCRHSTLLRSVQC